MKLAQKHGKICGAESIPPFANLASAPLPPNEAIGCGFDQNADLHAYRDMILGIQAARLVNCSGLF